MSKKPYGYWTFSRLKKEALKYNYKCHFKKHSASAYTTARRNLQVYKVITSHMLDGNLKKSNDKIIHTVKNVIIKAKTCSTKSEFRKKFRKECNALNKRGLLNQVFETVDFQLENKNSSMGELSCLAFLNDLLKINLVKTKVSWLGKNRKKIEFDGMDLKRKIAFEYNGPFHNSKTIKKLDRFKNRECNKRGFKLIIIKEYKRLSKHEFLIQSIKDQVFKEIDRLNLKTINKKAQLLLIPNNKGFSLKDIIITAKLYNYRSDFFKNHTAMYNFLNSTRQLHFISHLKRKRPNTHFNKKISKKIKSRYTPNNWTL